MEQSRRKPKRGLLGAALLSKLQKEYIYIYI
jgi:hypothetical protein